MVTASGLSDSVGPASRAGPDGAARLAAPTGGGIVCGYALRAMPAPSMARVRSASVVVLFESTGIMVFPPWTRDAILAESTQAAAFAVSAVAAWTVDATRVPGTAASVAP